MEFIPPYVKNSSAGTRPAYRLLYAGRAALCAGFCTLKEKIFGFHVQARFLQRKTKAPVHRTGAFAHQEALLEPESEDASDAVSSSAAVSSWAEREMRVSTESADSRYTAGSPESWA